MNYWKVILATIVIFSAGVITGGLVVGHASRPSSPLFSFRKPPPPPKPVIYDTLPPRLRPDFLNTNFVEELNDNLDLDQKQREQIRRIIAQAQQNTHDLWKLVAPQFQVVWHDTREQIRDVLTPDQKRKFEFLLKQQHQLRRQSATNAPPDMPSATTNGPVI